MEGRRKRRCLQQLLISSLSSEPILGPVVALQKLPFFIPSTPKTNHEDKDEKRFKSYCPACDLCGLRSAKPLPVNARQRKLLKDVVWTPELNERTKAKWICPKCHDVLEFLHSLIERVIKVQERVQDTINCLRYVMKTRVLEPIEVEEEDEEEEEEEIQDESLEDDDEDVPVIVSVFGGCHDLKHELEEEEDTVRISKNMDVVIEDDAFSMSCQDDSFDDDSGYSTEWITEPGDTEDRGLAYTCVECELTFTSINAVRNHELRCHNGQELVYCVFCDKHYGKVEFDAHRHTTDTDEEESVEFICPFCSDLYLCYSKFYHHLEICDKASENENPRSKNYCDECKRSFSSKSSLNRHITNIHSEKRKFISGVVQSGLVNLQERPLLSLLQTPFVCCQCGSSYGTEKEFVHHMNVHHDHSYTNNGNRKRLTEPVGSG